ncbi:DUF4349 domain-containing protein [Sporosalibacterium faouarense]|uniref:DUF4349 domain-containing protein n=1 Tax=Sporosalibacterium faouarense TaxID=516123 RepID=UPI00192AAD49|nr:DUF4349 domain-containing protein [Sporosalibacterium faouarense]
MCLKLISRHKIILLILVITIVLSVVGCSSGGREDSSTDNYDKSSDYDRGATESNDEANGGFNDSEQSESDYGNDSNQSAEESNTLQNRKIIKSANISIETKTFDNTVDEIARRTDIVGGYIERSNVTGKRITSTGNSENRQASFRLRIPQDEFANFILDFGNLGNIINNRTDGQDITNQYFDTEARLKTLEIQEDRLLEILKKAEKVEDIIDLERELSDIRYKIENLTGTIKKWDNLVSYSTIDVTVYEVQEVIEVKETPVTFGEKIKDGFNNSVEALVDILKGLVIFIISIIPFLIVIIPIGLICLYIFKKRKDLENKNKEDDKNIKE